MSSLALPVPHLNPLPWYSIRTRSNQERTAAHALSCRGYEQYVPSYTLLRRWSDRVVETSLPLFPGYVFCRFDAQQRSPILATPGVVAIIGFGNVPAVIEDAEIEAVQMVLRSGFSPEPCSFLREGQKIRIKTGAMEGLEGILLKKKSQWRLVVSVSMLQRSISVEIDRDSIETVVNPDRETVRKGDGCCSLIIVGRTGLFFCRMVLVGEAEASNAGEQLAEE